jgi:hypothetical protein
VLLAHRAELAGLLDVRGVVLFLLFLRVGGGNDFFPKLDVVDAVGEERRGVLPDPVEHDAVHLRGHVRVSSQLV